MTPRQAPRTLLIILAMAGLWAAYLLLQRPSLHSRGVASLDWGNVVGFPLLIVAMYMVSRYLLWRNNPTRRKTIPGVGEALATGVAWGIIKAVQERYSFGSFTLAPILSGVVVFLTVLAGNWVVTRMLRDG